ncbi:MAG: hypothetical protein GY842_06120 [bacterium]|nr:hypothetical protein [bacterium]
MTTLHASATGLPPPVPEPATRHIFRLICGGCGGEIVVDSDSAGSHARCPHCTHRVKVVRSASHTCVHCGAKASADLARGTSVGICDRCKRPYMVGTATAPLVKRHHHHHHHHRRPRSAPVVITRENGIGVIVMSAVILLSMLVVVLMSLS